MVERGDLVEVGEDLVAQRRLGRLVGLQLGVEAQLEVAHELRGDRGVGHQHVVLVALGEARADALAVLAVRAQDRHLAAVEPGGDHQPVEVVGLGVAAVDGGEQLRHAVADARRGPAARRRGRARGTPAPTSRRRRPAASRSPRSRAARGPRASAARRPARPSARACRARPACAPRSGCSETTNGPSSASCSSSAMSSAAVVRRRVALVVLGQVRRPRSSAAAAPAGAP